MRKQNGLSRAILESIPAAHTTQGWAAITLGVSVIATQQDVGGNRGESVTASIIHGNRAGDAARQPDGMGINTMLGTGGGVNDLERVAKSTCAGGRERGAPLGAEAWPVIMALGRAPGGAVRG